MVPDEFDLVDGKAPVNNVGRKLWVCDSLITIIAPPVEPWAPNEFGPSETLAEKEARPKPLDFQGQPTLDLSSTF